jgi:ATP-dependent protease ClpP protease subunit
VDIHLSRDIDPGACGADWLRAQLPTTDAPVTLRVNCAGGDVYEAVAMTSILREFPGHITAVVEGLAASAASFLIAGAADRTIMRPGAELMVHNPWTALQGDGPALVKAAGDLERLGATLARTYATKAGGTEAQWAELMAAETWFSAEEAVAAGLADEVTDARTPTAAHTNRTPIMARYKYTSRAQAPKPKMEDIMDPDPTTPPADPADIPQFTAEQWTKLCELLEVEPSSTIDTALDVIAAMVDKLAGDETTDPATGAPQARSSRILLDRHTYNDLVAGAREGMIVRAEREAQAREDEVDSWVKTGRIGAATRPRAVAMAHRDMQAARDLFGANPEGTVNRTEMGHGVSSFDSMKVDDKGGWVR